MEDYGLALSDWKICRLAKWLKKPNPNRCPEFELVSHYVTHIGYVNWLHMTKIPSTTPWFPRCSVKWEDVHVGRTSWVLKNRTPKSLYFYSRLIIRIYGLRLILLSYKIYLKSAPSLGPQGETDIVGHRRTSWWKNIIPPENASWPSTLNHCLCSKLESVTRYTARHTRGCIFISVAIFSLNIL